jgi:zinc transport system substrate-binding protein
MGDVSGSAIVFISGKVDRMRLRTAALPLCLLLGVTACGEGGEQASAEQQPEVAPLSVVAGVYPYDYVASRVGGADVAVTVLTPPGVDPHDLELTPRQVGELRSQDLVLYASGFQPALDRAVEQQAADQAFDVHTAVELQDGYTDPHADEEGEHVDEHAGEGEDPHADEQVDEHAGEGEDGHADEQVDEHAGEGEDPHVWLDPQRYATIAEAVADRLAELRPERADAFRERATALTADLTALDGEFREGLADCERRELVTSHEAFGYLASAYDLEQIGIAGLDQEDPSPRRLAEVATFARQRGVTTIFFEETVSPRLAEQLAREVGASTAVLTPLETAPEEGDYLTAMRDNLASLRAALDCR